MRHELSLVLPWPSFQLPIVMSYLETGSTLVHKMHSHRRQDKTVLSPIYWKLSATVANSVHTADKIVLSCRWCELAIRLHSKVFVNYCNVTLNSTIKGVTSAWQALLGHGQWCTAAAQWHTLTFTHENITFHYQTSYAVFCYTRFYLFTAI